MLESLGLGIRIDLIDNASPRARNLLTQFEALQRSAGNLVRAANEVNTVFMRFEGLTIAGFAMERVANTFNQIGRAMTGSLTALGKAVVETGSRFESYRLTLEALYKDAKIAKENLNWVVDFAARSPFEIDDTVTALKTFKAIGVDVRKEFANVNGVMKPFLEYIGDLAILAPAEQGMKGLMIALRNLFGGNERSFMMRMDIKPSQILGRPLAKDTEGLMQDIVELSQKLAPDLMEKLFGTWSQSISNLRDQYVRFLLAISDTGAFDAAKRSLRYLYELVDRIDQEEMQEIGKSLSSVFQMIWKPIDTVVKFLGEVAIGLKELLKTHPVIAKVFTGLVALGGIMFLSSGFVLKFTGTIVMAIASLGTFYITLLQYRAAEGAFSGTMMKIVKGIGLFTRALVLSTIGISAFIYIWSKNLFGFRDSVTKVTEDITKKWGYVKELFFGIWDSEREPIEKLMGLEGIEKVMAKIIGLGQIFSALFYQDIGNAVYFTQRQFENLNAVGLWELARVLVMVKGRFDALFKGIQEGFQFIGIIAKAFYEQVLLPIKAVAEGIGKALDNFLSKISGKQVSLFGVMPSSEGRSLEEQENQLDAWEKFGKIGGVLLATLLGFKAVKSLTSIITAPFQALARVMTQASDIAGKTKNRLVETLFPPRTLPINKQYLEGLKTLQKRNEEEEKLRRKAKEIGGLADGRVVRATKGIGGVVGGKYIISNIDEQEQSMVLSRLPWRRLKQEIAIRESLKNLRNIISEDQTTGLNMEEFLAQRKYRNEGFLDTESKQTEIYKDRQSILGRMLFGQRYSYYEQTPIGKDRYGREIMGLTRRTLAREGGLLRPRGSDDLLLDRTRGEEIKEVFKGIPKAFNRGLQLYLNTGVGRTSKLLVDAWTEAGELAIQDIVNFGKSLDTIPIIHDTRLALPRIFSSLNTAVRGTFTSLTKGIKTGVDTIITDVFSERYSQKLQREIQEAINREVAAGRNIGAARAMYAPGTRRRRELEREFWERNLPSSVISRGTRRAVGGIRGALSWGGERIATAFGADSFSDLVMGGRFRSELDEAMAFLYGENWRENPRAVEHANRLREDERNAGRLARVRSRVSNIAGRTGRIVRGAGRVGRGALRIGGEIGGGLMRGIGVLGGLGARAIPFLGAGLAVGQAAYQALSAYGGEEGVTGGVKKITDLFKSGEMDNVIENAKKTFSDLWIAIKDLGIAAWEYLCQNFPTMWDEAMMGLQQIAGIAWEWIKTQGIGLFKGLVIWLIKEGVPGLIKAILKVGTWIITELLPTILKSFAKIFSEIGEDIWNALTKAVSSAWNFIKERLPGWVKKLFGIDGSSANIVITDNRSAISSDFPGVPRHHGGLWNSATEHPAIIRKDETVLPPTISRKLNTALSNNTFGRAVDNSITIQKVEVIVQADRLSRSEAREQALMIMEEFKKLQRENELRTGMLPSFSF